MEDPFAAIRSIVRSACLSAAEAGNTHSSAPESTKKDRLDKLSLMEMVPLERPTVAINGRPFRFPKAARPGSSLGRRKICRSRPAYRTSCVRNTARLGGGENGVTLAVGGGGRR